MKNSIYQRRFYRDWNKTGKLCRVRITVQETDLEISSDRPVDKDFCLEKVFSYRRQIENYIARDPRFLVALKPLAIEPTAPAVVKKMGLAASRADVGPMAAVAGAIAHFLGMDLLKKGFNEVIIENGGDIFLKITEPRTIGIYCGRKSDFNRLALKIAPSAAPRGICASSATVGHSLSFGAADAAIVFARDAALADAVATAVGNRIKAKDDLGGALGFCRSIKGVTGAILILKKYLASWGDVVFTA